MEIFRLDPCFALRALAHDLPLVDPTTEANFFSRNHRNFSELDQYIIMKPITFTPLYMERVWGGRELENKYGRALPTANTPFGESWEMTDRPHEQSVVTDGTYQGLTLGELWQKKREEIFGVGFESDALGGEPKTEMWYIADAEPNAKLYVGMKEGVSRESFQQAIENGTVDEVVHSISPKTGDSIFIPSGRLHAIGAGLLIYEIQQNSDTTYRVFDWNRMGLDEQPRQLHVEESMRCIDFADTEPAMDTPNGNTLASCSYFQVDRLQLTANSSVGNPDPERFSIVTVVAGTLESADGRTYVAGDFLLLPRDSEPLTAKKNATILQTTIPR